MRGLMLRTQPVAPKPASQPDPLLQGIRKKIALSMIGRVVDLLQDAHTIAHGVVTGVFIESGTPKIVVDGARYGLNQILTVTPARFN